MNTFADDYQDKKTKIQLLGKDASSIRGEIERLFKKVEALRILECSQQENQQHQSILTWLHAEEEITSTNIHLCRDKLSKLQQLLKESQIELEVLKKHCPHPETALTHQRTEIDSEVFFCRLCGASIRLQ